MGDTTLNVISQNDIGNVAIGKVVRHIRTLGRGKGGQPWVELNFRYGLRHYELHAAHGWKIVSAMINTVRYQPEVVRVTRHYTPATTTVTFEAVGGYKVCEFTAVREDEDADLQSFELHEKNLVVLGG